MFAASDCAICLGQFAVGDEIRELPPCRHAYHVACIDIWLGSHSFCPYCRQILVVDGRFPANKREYRMINVFLP
ncbi:hypothetical protein TIFTF001_004844 [Ficus carica]|uniref:RING-type domain-containing protein n=1 Tax=Ficus carica TaxID=3494 RepID=A0AA88CXV3_FICCA|nr:hypothetical protein TIFTF001_004844 [Ficus carica]